MGLRLRRMLFEGPTPDGGVNSFGPLVDAAPADTVSESSPFAQLRFKLKSDEELMAMMVQGEADCLTVLFSRHSALVFRIAHRLLRNEAEAEDAVQQVFLDAYRAARQFDPQKGSLKSWVLMLAYHRTFNRLRQLRSSGYYVTDELEEDALTALFARASRPLAFSPAEASLLLEQALQLIQPRQRRTIELVYYEGCTAEEVALRTGETVRVVRHNLYRGLEKLRTVLCINRDTAVTLREHRRTLKRSKP